jgi:ABC-type amino acid transport substrate-binding protein
MRKRLLQSGLFFLTLICGYANATPFNQHVRLFLQDNYDVNGKKVLINDKQRKLFDYFEHKTGLKFDLVFLPWKRAQQETMAGKGIIYGFSKSQERLQNFQFSEPVMAESIWAITYESGNKAITKIDDLQGKTICIGPGVSYGIEFEQARKQVFTTQEGTESSLGRLQKLVSKNCDVMLWSTRNMGSQNQMQELIKKMTNNTPELKDKHFTVSMQPLFFDTIHFAAAKNAYADVMKKINHMIVTGKMNGSLDKLARFEN